MGHTEVPQVSMLPTGNSLVGCSVDAPRSGSRVEGRTLSFQGWVMTRGLPAVAVEIVHEGLVLKRARLRGRADAGAAHPDAPRAQDIGFGFDETLSCLAGKNLRFELRAVREDQGRTPFAAVDVEYRSRRAASDSEIPLVSVVIPCFDQAHFLGEAIESVLSQSYDRLEVLVVDDGSNDNTSAVVASYPGVRYLRQANAGLAAARNTGIRETAGEFLLFLDADDRLVENAIETGLAAFGANPECVQVSGHHRDIAMDGRILWEHREEHDLAGDPFEALLRRNYIPSCGAVIFRRSLFSSVGLFDTERDACEDYDFHLRTARRHPIACHHATVLEYRRHGTNMSRDPRLMLREVVTVLRRQRPFVGSRGAKRAAYRAGLRFYREHFGGQLAERLDSNVWRRDWRAAFGDALCLLRYYPQGLWRGRANRTAMVRK